MIKQIIITILALIFFTQTAIAEEKNNKLNIKFNQFWIYVNEKIDDTKDYQVKKWNEGKLQITETRSNFLKRKKELTGFFLDFSELSKK